MSLELNLAVLAEGVGADLRGSVTLIAANPHALVVEQFPVQVAPVFFVVVEDTSTGPEQVIAAGRTFEVRVDARSLPDDEVVFFAQFRQQVLPSNLPALRPRVQVTAQVPFTVPKAGDYSIHARITVIDDQQGELGVVDATRSVKVADMATLRQGPED